MKAPYQKIRCISGILIIVLLALYLGIFAYLNLAKYDQHVDSDIAAEALLTREIWEQKTLTPDDWISSTERRILAMPAVAALFYGITGSMQTAVGIACVLLGGIFFACFYFFLKKCGLSRLGALLGVVMICALPVNGIRNEGQIVPFISLLLYLFAEYYVFHCILLFVSILFYLYLKKVGGKEVKGGKFLWGIWVLLFGFTAVLSLGGQRCFQMVIIPLFLYECISLFTDTRRFTVMVDKGRLLATGYVGTSVLAGGISLLYDRQADYPMYLQTPDEIMNRLFLIIPGALLEGFGIAGRVKLGSFASMMQLLVWAFLILVIYGLVYVFRQKDEAKKEQKEALLLMIMSLGVTVFIISVTTAEAAHNYFMVAWFAAIMAVVILYDCLMRKGSWFAHVIVAAVCLFAVLNLKYTWYDAVTTKANLKAYEEVAEYLEEQNISYGYGEFWDASRISLIKDGAITMGHTYLIEDLGMYWWLTSTKWYPPNLPRDMKTAYVVKQEKREVFEKQFEENQPMRAAYENEKFAVYISEINYVSMP